MTKITQMHGCGNTFTVVDGIKYPLGRKEAMAENIAMMYKSDGILIVLHPETNTSSENDSVEMMYFDVDRSTKKIIKRPMCGNGIRCVARYAFDNNYISKDARILTGDGWKSIHIDNGMIHVNMGTPREFKKIKSQNANLEGYFVNTSLPNIVYFVDHLDKEEVRKNGLYTIYDRILMGELGNQGSEVNFTKLEKPGVISIMTCEYGVFDVTKACGTGTVASAFVSNNVKGYEYPIEVRNPGGILFVDQHNKDLFLIGPADYC